MIQVKNRDLSDVDTRPLTPEQTRILHLASKRVVAATPISGADTSQRHLTILLAQILKKDMIKSLAVGFSQVS